MLETIGIIRSVLVVLHFIGLAALLGGFLVQIKALRAKTAEVIPAMVHGAWTALITGLLLVGVAQWALAAGASFQIDHTKIAAKTIVALIVVILVMLQRKKKPATPAAFASIGALTTLNVVLAVFW